LERGLAGFGRAAQGVYQVNLGKRPYERFTSEHGKANRIVVPVIGAAVSLRFARVGAPISQPE
jgi:hypothetical protein